MRSGALAAPIMHDAIVAEFADAIAAAGLTCPAEIVADGRLRRFASNGKRGDDSGWYTLHSDGVPAGAFGDWRTGLRRTWRARSSRRLTPAQEAEHRERVEQMRREREAEQLRQQDRARGKARRIWKYSQPAAASHAYLVAKAIAPHGLRLHAGALVVPMRDTAGELHSLQFVAPDGGKLFLAGGRAAGSYFGIGCAPTAGAVLAICEGFATGASVHDTTGHAVAVAFNAGNLEPAARALRQKYPDARVLLCADNDESGIGERKARQAARAVRGVVAIPPAVGEDFNDLHREHGADAVRRILERALEAGE